MTFLNMDRINYCLSLQFFLSALWDEKNFVWHLLDADLFSWISSVIQLNIHTEMSKNVLSPANKIPHIFARIIKLKLWNIVKAKLINSDTQFFIHPPKRQERQTLSLMLFIIFVDSFHTIVLFLYSPENMKNYVGFLFWGSIEVMHWPETGPVNICIWD